MNEGLDQRGFFWLQGPTCYADVRIPDSAKSGRLEIDRHGFIQLRVDGDLGLNIPPSRYFTGFEKALAREQVIAGYLNDGQRAFLYENSLADYHIVGGSVASHTFEALFCLTSHHSLHDQPVPDAIESLQIQASKLNRWMSRAGIRTELIDRQIGGAAVKVAYDDFHKDFQLPEGELSITTLTTDPTSLGFTFPADSITFSQDSLIQLTVAHGKPLEEWRRTFLDIEELFALLLGCYCDLDWPTLICKHTEGNDWLTFYFRRESAARSYQPGFHNTMVAWMWIEDSFGPMLSEWCRVKRENPASCSLFMSLLRRQEVYLEHRFVTLMWCFEALHRSTFGAQARNLEERVSVVTSLLRGNINSDDLAWVKRKLERAEEVSLQQRIHDILENLPLPASTDAIQDFAKKCADYRNEISHFGGPRVRPVKDDYYEGLVASTEAAQVLFGAALLMKSGVNRSLMVRALRETPNATGKVLPRLRKVNLLMNTINGGEALMADNKLE